MRTTQGSMNKLPKTSSRGFTEPPRKRRSRKSRKQELTNMAKDHIESIKKELTRELCGGSLRFGRTHKITKQFKGVVRAVDWSGPSNRRGGAFVILCDYSDMLGCTHHEMLKRMLSDYSSYLNKLKENNVQPLKKRRKGYAECRNLSVNTSNDLEVFLNGGWVKWGSYIPSTVRELDSRSVERWLSDRASVKVGGEVVGKAREPPKESIREEEKKVIEKLKLRSETEKTPTLEPHKTAASAGPAHDMKKRKKTQPELRPQRQEDGSNIRRQQIRCAGFTPGSLRGWFEKEQDFWLSEVFDEGFDVNWFFDRL